MRGHTNGGLSVLRRWRGESEHLLPSHPYPHSRAEDVASIPREGAGQLLGRPGDPAREREAAGHCPSGGKEASAGSELQVEGRRAAHLYVQ